MRSFGVRARHFFPAIATATLVLASSCKQTETKAAPAPLSDLCLNDWFVAMRGGCAEWCNAGMDCSACTDVLVARVYAKDGLRVDLPVMTLADGGHQLIEESARFIAYKKTVIDEERTISTEEGRLSYVCKGIGAAVTLNGVDMALPPMKIHRDLTTWNVRRFATPVDP